MAHSYRFLVDRNVAKVAGLLPKKRVVTLASVDLPDNVSDRKIVEMARQNECIIVTANGDDFVREIERFQKTPQQSWCHDLWGLVVLPNDFATQSRVLKGCGSKLRLDGKRLSWKDIWLDNRQVRLKRNGGPEVRKFSTKCLYCLKQEQGKKS